MAFKWLVSKDGLYLYASHNPTIRADLNGNVYGGGCFGGGDDTPQMQLPPAKQYKTAPELFGTATDWAKQNVPLAYGARESALGDINKGTSFYESFQPTSFEQALGNQYFQNVWPGAQVAAKHAASLTGMESQLPTTLGNIYGNIATPIGEYLANLGNQRAASSLNARLGIDPYSTYSPYLTTDLGQSNAQTESDYQRAMQQATLDYQSALNDYQQKQAMISTLSSLGGGAIGFALGGPVGASLGSSIAGSASPLWGGGSSPVSFQDALSISQMFPNRSASTATPYTGLGSSGGYFKQFENMGSAVPANAQSSQSFDSLLNSGSTSGLSLTDLLNLSMMGGF